MLILNLTEVNLLKGHQTEFLYDGKLRWKKRKRSQTGKGKLHLEKERMRKPRSSRPTCPHLQLSLHKVKVPSLQHKAGPAPPGLRTCRASVS